jgi:hypothetical protein
VTSVTRRRDIKHLFGLNAEGILPDKGEPMHKKFFLIGVACAALMFLAGCPTTDDGGGGQGADFDENLYYTKAEIDALFADVYTKSEVYTKGAVDALLPTPGGFSDTLTNANTTYDDGLAITIPTGYKYLLLEVTGFISSTNDIAICIGNSAVNRSESRYAPNEGSTALMFFDVRQYTTGSARVWASVYDGTNMRVIAALWFK